jgi:hypothetical protein
MQASEPNLLFDFEGNSMPATWPPAVSRMGTGAVTGSYGNAAQDVPFVRRLLVTLRIAATKTCHKYC